MKIKYIKSAENELNSSEDVNETRYRLRSDEKNVQIQRKFNSTSSLELKKSRRDGERMSHKSMNKSKTKIGGSKSQSKSSRRKSKSSLTKSKHKHKSRSHSKSRNNIHQQIQDDCCGCLPGSNSLVSYIK